MAEIEGGLDAAGLRIGIAVATFNEAITTGLLAGAREAVLAAGGGEPTVVRVPGSFELPVVARALIEAGCHGVVALGAVIEGETDHYEHVATQAAAGLRQVAAVSGVPVGLGVLTVRDAALAVERSRPGAGNKGAETAEAVIRTIRAIRSILGERPAG